MLRAAATSEQHHGVPAVARIQVVVGVELAMPEDASARSAEIPGAKFKDRTVRRPAISFKDMYRAALSIAPRWPMVWPDRRALDLG